MIINKRLILLIIKLFVLVNLVYSQDSLIYQDNKIVHKNIKVQDSIIQVTIFDSIKPTPTRPKIGLCLSGGGARGMAHIGVLKVLDSAGIKIDYITGVSMGAIVGGLYSIGYSVDSLYNIFTMADWKTIVSDLIDQTMVEYEEKEYTNNYLINFPIIRSGIRLPSGVVPGQQIGVMLSKYAWPANEINDFDSLPIPFKCVAADIETCKKVVIDKGILSNSLRASMSVPTLFDPMKIDTMLLVDGGLIRNMAVDELKEMGADIVIGVYTGRRMLKANELHSLTSILIQTASFVGLYDAEEQMEKCDYVIKPEYEDINPSAFNKADTIINRGYQAALPYFDVFKKLSDSLNAIAPAYSKKKSLVGKDDIVIDDIVIEGNKTFSDYQILGILDVKKGESVNQQKLSQKMNILFGTNYFYKISYSTAHNNGQNILIINCDEKPRASLLASVYYDNYINAGANISFVARNYLIDRTRFVTNVFISENYRLNLNYLFYIDRKQKNSISIDYSLLTDELPLYSSNNHYSTYHLRNYNFSLNYKHYFNLNTVLRIGIEDETLTYVPNIIDEGKIWKSKYYNLNPFAEYDLNTLDDKHFPKEGKQLHSELKFIYSYKSRIVDSSGISNDDIKNYFHLNFSYKQYLKINEKWSFSHNYNLSLSSDSALSQNDVLLLGGASELSKSSVLFYGFKNNEIITKNIFKIGAGLHYNFHEKWHASFIPNASIYSNSLYRFENDYEIAFGYGIELGYSSPIGPIKLVFMQGDYAYSNNLFKTIKFYFSLGFGPKI